MRKQFPDGVDPRELRPDRDEIEPHVQPHADGVDWGFWAMVVLCAVCIVGLGAIFAALR